jgi:hypothetical protein
MTTTLEYIAKRDEQRFLAIYEGLLHDGFGPLDGELAKLLKFRPQAIKKLPLPQRARHARNYLLGRKQGDMAYEILGAYLVKHHRALVTDFLDAAGIPHEEGMLEEDAPLPDEPGIHKAVEALDQKYPREEVTMYLALCGQTWPEVERFGSLWKERG